MPVSAANDPTTAWAAFIQEEDWAAAARGQRGDPFANLTMPKGFNFGDFWNMLATVEQFAANTGWRYMPSPQQIFSLVQQGAASWDSLRLNQFLANRFGIEHTMPWAGAGLSPTQWGQATRNLNEMIFEMTGHANYKGAGIDQGLVNQALAQGWSQQQLQAHLIASPSYGQRFGYLKYGYNYQQFQVYKTQNADKLRDRYGINYSDSQAVQDLGHPQTAFHAQGNAWGQQTPYVSAQQAPVAGVQSTVR